MVIDELLKYEKYVDRVFKMLVKTVKNGGFLFWIISYWWLFFKAIDNISRKYTIIFTFVGIILIVVTVTWIIYLKVQKELIEQTNISYYDFVDLLKQYDLWPKTREKEIEQKIIDMDKNMISLLRKLKEI